MLDKDLATATAASHAKNRPPANRSPSPGENALIWAIYELAIPTAVYTVCFFVLT